MVSEIPLFGSIGKREGDDWKGMGRTEDRQEVQTDRNRRRSISESRCLATRSRSSLGS